MCYLTNFAFSSTFSSFLLSPSSIMNFQLTKQILFGLDPIKLLKMKWNNRVRKRPNYISKIWIDLFISKQDNIQCAYLIGTNSEPCKLGNVGNIIPRSFLRYLETHLTQPKISVLVVWCWPKIQHNILNKFSRFLYSFKKWLLQILSSF